MSEKIVNIGIIGTGKLGTYHLEKLQNISNCNLIGIYDINQDTLNEYERKYQVNICNSLEDLLAQCDGVTIATPTTNHHKIRDFYTALVVALRTPKYGPEDYRSWNQLGGTWM